ncbi:hypothetical protein LTR56_010524 [Elasticomyces elasticus]|nr:hypothetical protein LTR56_010524 [Elasticomyces elasticus]KAK3657940.1 hypothetical protein LTR22_009167 [Elasticomyces elasticus]KAK5762847.1 hypothetical protein LTS12_007036 [Elasticomyces elasticus]
MKEQHILHAPVPASYLSSSEVADLAMPALIEDRWNEKSKGSDDKWDRQSYQSFADKLMKKNPKVSFSKQLTDDALRYAVSKVASTAGKDTKDAVGPESGRGRQNVEALPW